MKKILLLFSMIVVFGLIGCTSQTDTTQTTAMVTTNPMTDYINDMTNPFCIGLFVTQDLTTSIGINFEMPENTDAYVEYAVSGSNHYIREKASKKVRQFGEESVYLYELIIDELTPNTVYEYRVANKENTLQSDYYYFKTQNPLDDEHTMMFLADPQSTADIGYMAYAYAIMSVWDYAQTDVDLVMLPGDIVADRDVRTQWNMFFKYSSMFSVNIPIAATTGNHEIPNIIGSYLNATEFDGYMNLPNNGPNYVVFDEIAGDARYPNFDTGKTYSFDYGAAHVTVINTETLCDGTISCANYDVDNAEILVNWLTNDLSQTNKTWKIVMLHRGPYGLSYDTENVRQLLVPVFEEQGVDLVLAGHEHKYSRAVYWNGDLVNFQRANDYTHGTLSLIASSVNNFHFNNYSTSLGITYLTANTSATKFYSEDVASNIDVNYAFTDEYPVIPLITVSESGIRVVSYAVEKSSGLSIIPNEVFVLEEFTIIS